MRGHFEFLVIQPSLFYVYPVKSTVKELLVKQNPRPGGTYISGEVTKTK